MHNYIKPTLIILSFIDINNEILKSRIWITYIITNVPMHIKIVPTQAIVTKQVLSQLLAAAYTGWTTVLVGELVVDSRAVVLDDCVVVAREVVAGSVIDDSEISADSDVVLSDNCVVDASSDVETVVASNVVLLVDCVVVT